MAELIRKTISTRDRPPPMKFAAFKSAAGRVYVRDFLSTRRTLRLRLIARMESHCREYDAGQFQPDGMKVRAFPGGKFDGEIRVKHHKEAFRFPYWIDKTDRRFILLDGFPKKSGKSDQWPKRDVTRAERRLREYQKSPAAHRAPVS